LTRNDEADRLDLGASGRAANLNRFVLAEARQDPVIAGQFCMREQRRLECVLLEGDGTSPSISLVFNKANRNPYTGWLRTAHNLNKQRAEMRSGQLFIDGCMTVPLVCYYTLADTSELLNPVIESVGIGPEGKSGFYWVHRVWSLSTGMLLETEDDQLTLYPQPVVRLRRAKPAESTTPRIGIPQEQSRGRDAERRESDVSKTDTA